MLVKTVATLEKMARHIKLPAVATESLNAIRVTNALNIQPVMAKRYNSHLGLREKRDAYLVLRFPFLVWDDVFDVLLVCGTGTNRGGFDGQCTKNIHHRMV